VDGVIQGWNAGRLVEDSGRRKEGVLKSDVADEEVARHAGGLGLREFYSLSIACKGIGVVAETVTRLCQMAMPGTRKGLEQ